MNITLRTKKLRNGKRSYYLDYTLNGQRIRETLGLYVTKSNNLIEKDHNKEIKRLAEQIRAKKELELKSSSYGFNTSFKTKTNFLGYFMSVVERRKSTKTNYENWLSTYKHLEKCVSTNLTFENVNEKLLEDIQAYLLSKLSRNSAATYYNKVAACLNLAYDEKIIQDNPSRRVKGIKPGETKREFLTVDELNKLVNTDCEIPILKMAFLFSSLTGLRWSDIVNLKWKDISYSKEYGNTISFRQQKTKNIEFHPIHEQSMKLIGPRMDDNERVFKDIKYSAWHNLKIAQWVMRADIKKKITFHCARHTYATLQFSKGVDIYTISKLLGHRDLKTTLIYTKVIDIKKVEAARNFPLLNF
jgi:integrase